MCVVSCGPAAGNGRCARCALNQRVILGAIVAYAPRRFYRCALRRERPSPCVLRARVRSRPLCVGMPLTGRDRSRWRARVSCRSLVSVMFHRISSVCYVGGRMVSKTASKKLNMAPRTSLNRNSTSSVPSVNRITNGNANSQVPSRSVPNRRTTSLRLGRAAEERTTSEKILGSPLI